MRRAVADSFVSVDVLGLAGGALCVGVLRVGNRSFVLVRSAELLNLFGRLYVLMLGVDLRVGNWTALPVEVAPGQVGNGDVPTG